MLKSNIQQDILIHLKAKNESALKAVRYLLSQINYAEIQKGTPLSDEDIQAVVTKEVKKRKEAITLFEKAGRTELLKEENKQLETILAYLPKQLSKEELSACIDQILREHTNHTQLGPIIGKVMAHVKGKASGDLVASMVKEKISQ